MDPKWTRMKDEKKLVFFDTSRWKVFFISNIILRIMEFSVRWSFIVIVLESSFNKIYAEYFRSNRSSENTSDLTIRIFFFSII